jgi:hypothetical protein
MWTLGVILDCLNKGKVGDYIFRKNINIKWLLFLMMTRVSRISIYVLVLIFYSNFRNYISCIHVAELWLWLWLKQLWLWLQW